MSVMENMVSMKGDLRDDNECHNHGHHGHHHVHHHDTNMYSSKSSVSIV